MPTTISVAATVPDQGYPASISAELAGIKPIDAGTLRPDAYASLHPAEFSTYESELKSVVIANPTYFPSLVSFYAAGVTGTSISFSLSSPIPVIPTVLQSTLASSTTLALITTPPSSIILMSSSMPASSSTLASSTTSTLSPSPALRTFHTSPKPLYSSAFVPQHTPAPVLSRANSTPVGAIAGGVVGGVVVIAIVGIIAFLLRRAKKRKATASHRQEVEPRPNMRGPAVAAPAVVPGPPPPTAPKQLPTEVESRDPTPLQSPVRSPPMSPPPVTMSPVLNYDLGLSSSTLVHDARSEPDSPDNQFSELVSPVAGPVTTRYEMDSQGQWRQYELDAHGNRLSEIGADGLTRYELPA